MVVLFRFLSLLFLPRLTRAICAVHNPPIFARLGGTLGCIGITLFLFVSPAISSDFFPNLSYTHLEAGKALLNKGEVDEAIKEFRVAIQLHSSNAEAYSNLGYALGRKEDPNGAIAAYREALRLQLNEHEYTEAQFNLGYALGWKGDLEGAIAAWREGIRLRPDDASTRMTLEVAIRKGGSLERVIAAWREVVRLHPDDALAQFSLGVALGHKGDREGEINAYREAIRLQPKNALSHFNLGMALGEKGDINGEIAAYQEVIRLQPNNPDYIEAHFKFAFALGQRGDVDGATAAWRRGVQLNLREGLAHRNLGTSFYQKRNLEKVRAAWYEAIRLDLGDVNYPQIHYRVGEALAHRGVWNEAIKVYQGIVRLKPDDQKAQRTLMQAHHNRGLSFFENGKVDEAIEAFHLTLQLDPSYDPAKRDLQTALFFKKTTPN